MYSPHDPRLARADEYTRLALHNLGESEKLRGFRDRRVAQLRQKAARQMETRPTVSHTLESILDSLTRSDPRLDEYSAGLVITERRAALYSSMATDLRLQVLTDLLAGHPQP